VEGTEQSLEETEKGGGGRRACLKVMMERNNAWKLMGRGLICFGVVSCLLNLTGCVSTGPLLSGGLFQSLHPSNNSKAISQLAVVAEADVAEQDGKEIPGMVVQVFLLDGEGIPCSGEGSLVFSLYAENAETSEKMEPDDRFRFSGEEIRQASATTTLGTVHNFWLPRRGKLAGASRVQLVSVYKPNEGEALVQTNFVANERRKMEIKERTETIEPVKVEQAKKLAQSAGTSGTDK
jgi:hypothetical protein